MKRKWRPSLVLVLGGALAGTLVLSVLGLVALRYVGPEIGFRNAALLLAAIIGGLTALLALLLVRLLLRPIRGLARYGAAIRAGEDAAPPSHLGTAELHDMAVSVLEMARVLQRREATIRSFSDHVTHELKTPVSTITVAAELLEDAPGDPRLLAQIAGAATEMNSQLAALRDMARAREADYRGVSTLNAAAARLRADHPKLAIALEDGSVPLPISEHGLLLILSQLLANAVAHGASRIDLIASDDALVVRDDGPGIAAGNRDRVFDPFFTTRRGSGGTGMGLTIVAAILRSLGGRIVVLPDGPGAGFRLTFHP